MKWKEILKLQKLRQSVMTKIVIFSKWLRGSKSYQQGSIQQSLQIQFITIDELLIKTFYEILKTKNLSLLKKGLNQKELKTNWDKILDEYSFRVDPDKYHLRVKRAFINIGKFNKFTILRAAIMGAELGSKIGFDAIKGYNLKTIEEAKRAVAVMVTNEKIRHSRELKKDVLENSYNFYKDLTGLEHLLNREINDSKTTVGKWVELVKLGEQIVKSNKTTDNGRN